MDKLLVPLAAVTETGVVVDAALWADDVRPEDAPSLPGCHLTVRGELQDVSGEYVFMGRIEGTYEHSCDRCLEPVTSEIKVDVVWNYRIGAAGPVSGESEEEDEPDDDAEFVCAIEGNEIDLAPQVWEEVVLAIPPKVLCSETCAGLCPRCGANLNRGRCACPEEEAMNNKGLAGLADLFPELRPKRPEE